MSPVSSVESWFFSSLGWNVPIPNPVLLGQHDTPYRDVFEHFPPVAVVLDQQILEGLAAEWIEIALDADLLVARQVGVDLLDDVAARRLGDQLQRFLVHRAAVRFRLAVLRQQSPAKAVGPRRLRSGCNIRALS